MDFTGQLDLALERLHQEGRYRTFIDIERRRGHFPHAVWRKDDGSEQPVTVCAAMTIWDGAAPCGFTGDA